MKIFLLVLLLAVSVEAFQVTETWNKFINLFHHNNKNETKQLDDKLHQNQGPSFKLDKNAYFKAKGSRNSRRHRGGTEDKDFQAFVDALWAADEDRAPKNYVQLNWGTKLHNDGTDSDPTDPLFKYVNESLFTRPIYKAQLDLYKQDLFVPKVCAEEKAMEGNKLTVLKNFFDLLTNSNCFKTAYEYLKKIGKANQSLEKFKKEVFVYWYGNYTRCKGPKGSSGFEHVFLGEQAGEKVDGQHNWVKFYLLEKMGQIKYHGQYTHDGDLIGTIKYTWGNYLKFKGGFFINTSPAFDFSLFTVCVITEADSDRCRFKIGNEKLAVKSFVNQCIGGDCIATAYPMIV